MYRILKLYLPHDLVCTIIEDFIDGHDTYQDVIAELHYTFILQELKQIFFSDINKYHGHTI